MKILFVYHKKMASFIKKDIEILKKRHQVKVVRYSEILYAYTIWKGVRWSDLTFCWFGSLHSFFAVLFSKVLGKKSIVVSGGYDVARVPEINYGLFCCWRKKWVPLFVFHHANLVLTISKNSTLETFKNARVDPDKINLVYLGFSSDTCKPLSNHRKERLVLTVGNVSKSNLVRKGLELFVKTSRLMPETEFVLVGKWIDDSIKYLKAIGSSNMRFLGEIDQEMLSALMSKSKVYVQVSRHEGFGCALAEAMLCECIPVVTKLAALPEVVGDCGFFLTGQSPEELAALIKKALNSNPELGKRARERIKTHFPLEKREKTLLQIIEQLRV
jgi:glycosyltransferase involved in cell wall biosynthesis